MSLGDDAYRQHWTAGQALTPDDAIDYGLGVDEPGERRQGASRTSSGDLSPREWEVAGLVAQGLSNRQIAEHLVISERTAENHVSHILDKLGLDSRTRIATWVVTHWLVNLASG